MKIKSKLLLLSVLLTSICYGQDSIKSRLVNNILAYHIKYGLDVELGVNSNLLSSNGFVYNLISLYDYELELFVKNDSSICYPIDGYHCYLIENPGFTFVGTKGNVKLNKFHSFMADRLYLIAYNKTNDDIKFVSGNMFLTPISKDFNVNSKDPKSLFDYLKCRYYNYKIKEIFYLKRKGDKLLYKAFSETLNEEVVIKVNAEYFDNTEITMIRKKEVY